MVAKRCPICAHCVCTVAPRKRKRKQPIRRYTVSVSAESYALFEAAAEARGWSVRQLVDEATK